MPPAGPRPGVPPGDPEGPCRDRPEGNRPQARPAQTALDEWQSEWDTRCAPYLPAGADTGSVDGALSLFAQMDDHLRQMRELRSARIDAMQRDLDDFARNADGVARALAPDLVDQPADEVARVLTQRLAAATEADKERRRLEQELDQARECSAKERNRIQEAQAELASLLHIAGVADNDALREAIARSDQARGLSADIRGALQTLQEGADGLSRETLEGEFAAADLVAIPGELAALKCQVDDVLVQQSRNAAELEFRPGGPGQDRGPGRRRTGRGPAPGGACPHGQCGRAVHQGLHRRPTVTLGHRALPGEKTGPHAESGRRHLRVSDPGVVRRVGGGLRERAAGPARAKGHGERVAIEGLSDGTRDQLYLALRLAALELHLEQGPPCPSSPTTWRQLRRQPRQGWSGGLGPVFGADAGDFPQPSRPSGPAGRGGVRA